MLLARGHLREAYARSADQAFPHIAPFELLSAESTAARHRATLDGSEVGTPTMAWLAAQGDTAGLRRVIRAADLAEQGGSADTDDQLDWAEAFLLLARRDSAGALERMLQIPDSLCACRPMAMLTRARLIRARQGSKAAFRALRFATISSDPLDPIAVVALLERAELAEQLGRREDARRDYAYVRDIWRRADPELQPYVARARTGLERVGADVENR
jgi:hypothetical protein